MFVAMSYCIQKKMQYLHAIWLVQEMEKMIALYTQFQVSTYNLTLYMLLRELYIMSTTVEI